MWLFLTAGLISCGPAPTVCPDAGTALTYDTFGHNFMSLYCAGCHNPVRKEKNVLLDTAAGVRTHASSSIGQAGTGMSMPPVDSLQPTTAERAQLTAWLSCGAP